MSVETFNSDDGQFSLAVQRRDEPLSDEQLRQMQQAVGKMELALAKCEARDGAMTPARRRDLLGESMLGREILANEAK